MKSVLKNVKLLSIVGGAFLLTMAGCDVTSDADEPLPPVSYVSLYQASPNSPDLKIVLDQKTIANSFEYTDHTGYLRFFTGDRKLEFGPASADNIVLDTTMKFEENRAYSIFVVDTYQKADILVLDDNTDVPAEGKAKLRFLNLSPDAPEIELAEANVEKALFEDQAFKETSEFIEVDAKSYDLVVKAADGDKVLLSLPNTVLLKGWSYTVIVRGFKEVPGGSTSVLSAELIVD
jgi:hypothetical protein